MARGLTWTLSLFDKMSKPFRSMSSSAKTLTKDLNGVARASKLADDAFIKRMQKSQKAAAKPIAGAKVGGAGGKKGGGLLGSIGEMAGPVGAALAGVTALVVALGAKLGQLAFAGTKYVADIYAFREGTLGAFAVLLKSKDLAESAYKKAIATASYLGTSPKSVLASYQQFLAKGFKVETVDRLVKSMADLQAINPKANIDNLTLALGQIKAKGVLQMEELQGQIAEAGLDIGLVFTQLAKKLDIKGKDAVDTITKVRKAISAGKVTGDMGVEAVMGAIGAMTGKELGKLSHEKAMGSLPGIIEAIKGQFEGMFLGLQSNKGFEAIKGVFRSVYDWMTGPGGKRLSDAFNKIFDSVGRIFGGIFDKKNTGGTLDTITSVVEHVAKVIDQSTPGILAFWRALMSGISVAKPAFDSLLSALQTANGAFGNIGAMRMFGLVLGSVISTVVIMVSAFAKAVGSIIDLVSWFFMLPATINSALGQAQGSVTGFGSSFSSAGSSLGASIMSGLTSGIFGGLGSVTSAMSSVATAAQSAITGPLKIQSPSKVFEYYGAMTAEGFARGAEGGAPQPRSVLSQMVGAPQPTATASGMAAGSKTISISGINLSVGLPSATGASGTPQEYATAATPIIRREVALAFERLALEIGAT